MTDLDPEEAALLREIIASPDDDAPRLIYADWIEERGQEERAEFICRQVNNPNEVLRCDADSSVGQSCQALYLRGDAYSMDVCESCSVAISFGLPWVLAGEDRYSFRRGFVESLRMTAAEWLTHCDSITARHPIRRVELTTELDWHCPSMGSLIVLSAGENVQRRCNKANRWSSGKFSTVVLATLAAEWPGIEFVMPERGTMFVATAEGNIEAGQPVYFDPSTHRVVVVGGGGRSSIQPSPPPP